MLSGTSWVSAASFVPISAVLGLVPSGRWQYFLYKIELGQSEIYNNKKCLCKQWLACNTYYNGKFFAIFKKNITLFYQLDY